MIYCDICTFTYVFATNISAVILIAAHYMIPTDKYVKCTAKFTYSEPDIVDNVRDCIGNEYDTDTDTDTFIEYDSEEIDQYEDIEYMREIVSADIDFAMGALIADSRRFGTSSTLTLDGHTLSKEPNFNDKELIDKVNSLLNMSKGSHPKLFGD